MVDLLAPFRRRRDDPLAEALTARPRGSRIASAAPVTPELGKRITKTRRTRAWQGQSFLFRRELPEVGYAQRFLANNCAHIRLFVGDRPRGADQVVELDEDYGWLDADTPDPDALPFDLVDAAREALLTLTGASPSGGGAAILAPIVQAFEGPGECWLVGRYNPDTDTEQWGVHSISELSFHEGRLPGGAATEETPRGYYRLTTGEGRGADAVDLDPATTTVVRLWTADPEWSAEPDSPMRTLARTCERLLLIDRAHDAVLKSRAGGNGIVLMPEEVSAVPAPDADGRPEADELMTDFTTQLVTPLAQDGSAASVVPMILRGPYQYLDRIRHLTLDRPLDPKLAELESRLLTRLGVGLDVPPEVITGYADVNHWNVWQVDSDTFKHHQEPITINGVDALTLGYLRHRLRIAVAVGAAAWTADQIDRLVIWYDPASLVSQPDMRENANAAFDRDTISAKAHRKYLGMDESDAPEPTAVEPGEPVGSTELTMDALTAMAVVAGNLLRAGYEPDSVSAALGLTMLTHTGIVPGATPAAPGGGFGEPAALSAFRPPAEEAPATGAPPARRELTAATTAAGSPPPPRSGRPTEAQRRLSRRLMEIDRRLRERITAAADAALRRALERAGNRVRSRANGNEAARTAAAGLPGELVPYTLGRALVAALGIEEQALLAEAFDKLREQYTVWTQAAADEAITTASRIAGLQPGDPAVMRAVGDLRDSFAAAADAAWPALHSGLNELAVNLLYEPNPALPELGELPDTLVPPGLARNALAVAGGLAADSTGLPPLPGFTSGQLLQSFLRGQGCVPVEYEWSYGISSRPFEPHRRLDGLVFLGYDDPALSTGTDASWIGGSLAPGDHKGCHCDAALIYADGNTRDEMEQIGRQAYREQKPGEPVPGWEATSDLRVTRPGYRRPETRRSADAAAAATARAAAPAPAPLPAGVPPQPPPAPTGRRAPQPTLDDDGVPWVLDHDYLSHLDEPELDDLLAHVAASLGDADPRAEARWGDLEEYLAFTERRTAHREELLESGHAWPEMTRRLSAWEEANGRPGLTHPRVGGTGRTDRTGPSRAEVADEYAVWTELEYLNAEEATRGVLLTRAGQARGISPRSLFTGDVRRVHRYASEELLAYWETTRRVTWTEFYYARTGNPNFAEAAARHADANARINRDRTER